MDGMIHTGGTYLARNMAPWKVVASGDFCGNDGNPDLVWQHATTNEVYVWLLDETSVTSGAYLARNMGPWKVVGPK